MTFLVTVLLSVALATVSLSAHLPSSFPKCDQKQKDFRPCLAKAVESVLQQLNKPFKDVGLPNMKPLEVPAMTIGAGSGAVAFQQNYKNIKLTGYENIKCSKADMDFGKKKLTLSCNIPTLTMDMDYEVNGKLLVLPIVGKGKGSIVLSSLHLDFTMALEEFDKSSKKHFKVIKNKLDLKPHLINYRFENLFDGDKTLGDNINKVMNENWKEVFEDVKPSYDEAFGGVYASIFNRLAEKVSIEDLFGNK